MHLNTKDIEDMHPIRRINLINGITGIKPANLIGTYSPRFGENLSIFNSLVHLGSNPALIGFILRPTGDVSRNTYENILESGYFTVNHVHHSFIDEAHKTSAKFGQGVSEFEKCGFQPEYIKDFAAPFVAESSIKMGVKFEEEVFVRANGTRLIVGSLVELVLPENCIDDKGYLRLDKANDVGIGGLNCYYSLKRVKSLGYARVSDFQD
ncbi:flavin reductase [Crocinitomicaceae bacterium]|nr:flavin reductase [Crocinitomicaceae bacterium]